MARLPEAHAAGATDGAMASRPQPASSGALSTASLLFSFEGERLAPAAAEGGPGYEPTLEVERIRQACALSSEPEKQLVWQWHPSGIMASQINASYSGFAAGSPCVGRRSMQTIWPPTAKHILPTGLGCWLYMVQNRFSPRLRRFGSNAGVRVVVEPGGPTGTSYGLWQSSYTNLTSYLSDAFGYTLGVDMFGAPFDWRLHLAGLERSGGMGALAAKVQAAVDANCGKKAVLIGHSMGGLVSLALLHRDPRWTSSYVAGFISVSAPWGGTSDQAIAVRMGSVDFNINDWVKMPMARAAADVKANHSADVAVAVASIEAEAMAAQAEGADDTAPPASGAAAAAAGSEEDEQEGIVEVPEMVEVPVPVTTRLLASGGRLLARGGQLLRRERSLLGAAAMRPKRSGGGGGSGVTVGGGSSSNSGSGKGSSGGGGVATAAVGAGISGGGSGGGVGTASLFNLDRIVSNYISSIFFKATMGLPGLSMLLPYASAYGLNRRIVVTARQTYTASMMDQLMEDIGDDVTVRAWRQVHELDALLAKGRVPGVPTHCIYAVGKDTALTWDFPNINKNRALLTSATLVTTGGDGTVSMQSLKQCYRITDSANITELGDYGHLEVLKDRSTLAQLGTVLVAITGEQPRAPSSAAAESPAPAAAPADAEPLDATSTGMAQPEQPEADGVSEADSEQLPTQAAASGGTAQAEQVSAPPPASRGGSTAAEADGVQSEQLRGEEPAGQPASAAAQQPAGTTAEPSGAAAEKPAGAAEEPAGAAAEQPADAVEEPAGAAPEKPAGAVAKQPCWWGA
ncbi:PLA2G15 [Scenedesmus sp. PABB004]|nr:PLA2G15 [Scenedesmus sp. PABB004]